MSRSEHLDKPIPRAAPDPAPLRNTSVSVLEIKLPSKRQQSIRLTLMLVVRAGVFLVPVIFGIEFEIDADVPVPGLQLMKRV